MKKILVYVLLLLIIILSACSNTTKENKVESERNSNVKKDVNKDTSAEGTSESIAKREYKDLANYISTEIKNPTDENISAHINGIKNEFTDISPKIIEKNIGKYIVFELEGKDNNSLCLWEKGKPTGEIIIDEGRYTIQGIIKDSYLIVNRNMNGLDSILIYDLNRSVNNKNFKSEIHTDNIYNIKNTDWILYQTPASNITNNNLENKAMNIRFYNLVTTQKVLYREAKDNYGWVVSSIDKDEIGISKVTSDKGSIKYDLVDIKSLNNWNEDFKPSTKIYEYGEIDEYLSKKLNNPTDENIKNYMLKLPEVVENSEIEIMDEYENDRYIVFKISQKVLMDASSDMICVWEKGNPNGGFVLSKWISQIEGYITDHYLMIDSGTWTIRSKEIFNMSLNTQDKNAYDYLSVLTDNIYNFIGTDWVIYLTQTENHVRNMPFDEVCDIELYNLKTNKKILYKEAKENYGWHLKTEENNSNLIEVVKYEGDENHKMKYTTIEVIDLNNWSAVANKFGIQ